MENRTLTKKAIVIWYAAIFISGRILSGLFNAVIMSLLAGFYQNTSDVTLYSYYSSIFTSVESFLVNIITIVLIIVIGKKLTGNKIGTVQFFGCYYFGSAVGTLFSSLVSNIVKYLAVDGKIFGDTYSTILTVNGILWLIPSILASYMAFTAFEGINDKIPAHPVNVPLSKARIAFIITFIVSVVAASGVESLPNYLLALINPESGSFASDALIFSGYLAKWLSNVIAFAVVYIAGYRMAKSHYGAISFYIPASALSVPVTAVIGNISSVIVNALKYSDMLKAVENGGADHLSSTMYYSYTGYVSIVSTVLTIVVSFVISFKALSLFYKKKTESIPVEQ